MAQKARVVVMPEQKRFVFMLRSATPFCTVEQLKIDTGQQPRRHGADQSIVNLKLYIMRKCSDLVKQCLIKVRKIGVNEFYPLLRDNLKRKLFLIADGIFILSTGLYAEFRKERRAAPGSRSRVLLLNSRKVAFFQPDTIHIDSSC